MTMNEFDQISDMRTEIKVLTKRINKAKSSEFVADYAKDYSSGFERIVTIQGYAMPEIERVKRLERQKSELERKVLEAENYIASIPDSKIRILLTLRFIEGEDWEGVAKAFYKKMSGDSARMCVKNYFNKR